MDIKKSTVCEIKTVENKFKKGRNLCENCYKINRKKFNNMFSGNDNNEIKVVNSVNIQIITKKETFFPYEQ